MLTERRARLTATHIATLALAGILLTGCQMNASTVELELHPDGTGEMRAYRLTVPEKPHPAIKGLTDRTDMTFEVVQGPFGDVKKVDIGGITATLTATPDGFTATVHVPTTAEAPWFAALGLDRAAIARLAGAAKRIKEEESQPRGAPDLTDALENPGFLLTVKLPGSIKSHKIGGKALPDRWTLESGRPSGGGPAESGSERQVRLTIPLVDIHDGKTPSVDLEITCGPATEGALKSWKKTKKKLE